LTPALVTNQARRERGSALFLFRPDDLEVQLAELALVDR
jgi:hypothetical protein